MSRLKAPMLLAFMASAGIGFALAAEPSQSGKPRASQVGGHSEAQFIRGWDRDGDGKVARAEYEAARKERFAATDEDGNGTLSADEYADEFAVRLARQIADERRASVEQTHVRFRSLDKDRDGIVSRAEYDASGSRSFEQLDHDQDGRITKQDPAAGNAAAGDAAAGHPASVDPASVDPAGGDPRATGASATGASATGAPAAGDAAGGDPQATGASAAGAPTAGVAAAGASVAGTPAAPPTPAARTQGARTQSARTQAARTHDARTQEISARTARPRQRSVINMPSTHDRAGFIEIYDKDGDGVVTRDEYNTLRASTFTRTDSNADGQVNESEYLEEFIGRLDRQIERARRGHLKQSHVRFESIDTNKDGGISREEYSAMSARMFERSDTSKNGVVSVEDPPPPDRERPASR